jgi:N-acetylmuramoyl-L-alanine amidase
MLTRKCPNRERGAFRLQRNQAPADWLRKTFGAKSGLGVAHCTLAALLAMPLLATSVPAGQLPEKPHIVSREIWGGQVADTALMHRQVPREIVIHHTSVRQQPGVSLEKKLRGLEGFSRKPGKVGNGAKPAWGDVPYHFYIDAKGQIGEGRSVSFAGDSNTKYETGGKIQIVLEGHFDREKPDAKQLDALGRLMAWLAADHKIGPDAIAGHNHFAATDCPGKNLTAHLPHLRERVSKATMP